MPDLLFVCLANRARSAFAELVARDALVRAGAGDAITVGSAGVWTPGGEPIWPAAGEAALARGLDPSGFVSRPLTPELVTGSALVLAATRELRDRVVAEQPAARDRVLTWRELAWTFGQVAPQWDGLPLAQRPAAVPGFVRHYRGRVLAPPPEAYDVADPAGAPRHVMDEAAALTEDAVRLVVEALCA